MRILDCGLKDKKIMIRTIIFASLWITTILVSGQVTYFSGENDAKTYFEKNIETLDPIEGIWSVSTNDNWYYDGQNINHQQSNDDGRIAVIKDLNGGYKTIKLTGEEYDIFRFEGTAIANYYLTKIFFSNGRFTQNCNASLLSGKYLTIETKLNSDIVKYQCQSAFEGTKFEEDSRRNSYKFDINVKFDLVKTYPNEAVSKPKITSSSGTGFAISNLGYIVTNYHVVENAKAVRVKGINGDFNSSVTARIELTDKNNDLAIIKLENGNTINGAIPYVISSKADVVGSDVFALGYPLRATMGDEVKLTNGIISANSGFQGDITKYQISVPVQPGNSGGPLINAQGNLIGVINAKHLETENVSYAVKSIYLQSLIASLTGNVPLTQTNLLTGKTLSQKVQLVKRFVYVIEVSY